MSAEEPDGTPGPATGLPGWTSPAGPPPAAAGSAGPGAPPGWGGHAWAPPPPAPRPGVVPLRPLGVGEILDGAITYIRANPRATLGLAAVIAVLGSVLQFVLLLAMFGNLASAAGGLSGGGVAGLEGPFAGGGTITDAQAVSLLATVGGVALVTVVVQFVLQTVGTGMLTHVMGRAVLGERIRAGAAWRLVRPQVWRLLALTLLVGLLVGVVALVPAMPGVLLLLPAATRGWGVALMLVGLLVGAVLAVWVWVRLALAPAALVLENAGPVVAMRRSPRLVRGSWWRVFGILLLAYVVAQVVAGILSLPFTLGGMVVGGAFADNEVMAIVASLFLSSLGAVVSATLTLPFTAGVSALLYIDQRMRREALDLTLARAGAGGPAPGNPGPPPDGRQSW